jgi:hypothetical protein
MTDRDDLTNGPPPTATEDAHTIMINRVSWGAILAGTVVALVVQVLLTMLGVGIGAATLDPVSGDNPEVSTFSMASAIWYGVSGLIAAFAGGYIAARMSGKTVPTTGALHGLTTWAVTTLLVLYLVSTSLGSIIGGTFRGIAGAVGGVGQAATEVAGPMLEEANPLEALERGVEATGTDPEALTASAVNAMRRVVMSDESGAGAGPAGGGAGALRSARHPAVGRGATGRGAGAAVPPNGGTGAADRNRSRRRSRVGRLHRGSGSIRSLVARSCSGLVGWSFRSGPPGVC